MLEGTHRWSESIGTVFAGAGTVAATGIVYGEERENDSASGSRRSIVRAGTLGLVAAGMIKWPHLALAQDATPEATLAALSSQEAQAIATDAFIYGFPMVENYGVIYAYAIDEGGPEYKAPFNEISNTARVYTPEDTAVVSPNSDTPYSWMSLDLRAEPVVLTVPPIEKERYFSWESFDLYTYLPPYIGSRTTGNGGGNYLFAGPNWTGETPAGIDMVLSLPTQIGLTLGRTQLFGPDDLENVIAIQAGYHAQPLSAFLGEPAPPPAPVVEWRPYDRAAAEGIGFFDYLSFLLQFAPELPEDRPIRERIAHIGVVPDRPFDPAALSAEMQTALQAGIAGANATMNLEIGALANAGEIFGSREFLRGRYLDRAAGARYGIYGNAKEEAIYVPSNSDATGQPLNGAGNRYTVRFAPDQLPPVNAFWSLTIYDGKTQLLVANPIDRYLINSPMLPDLKMDADGGLTLDMQSESPGAEREANWLPIPDGPFYSVLRMYWPKEEAIDGEWQAPPIERAS
jgi:hypothetical protein